MDDVETEKQPLTQSGGETFVDELAIPISINGMMVSKEAEKQYQAPDDVANDNTGVSFLQSKPNDNNHKLVQKRFSVQQQAVKGYEWIEMGVRGEQVGIYTDEEEKMVESQMMTNEHSVTWKHRVQSAPNLDHFTHRSAADPLRYNTTGPHALLLGGYPDVDYPINEDSTSQLPYQPTVSREKPEFLRQPEEGGISTKRNSDSQFVNQDTRRNSSYSLPDNMETSPEAWGFSKNLKSPGLRRRRPVSQSVHQGPSTQTSRQFFQGSGQAWPASNNYNLSNSDSDDNLSIKRHSVPPGQSSDSHRVLKLGSLKPNQGMFWNMHDRVSPDPQTLSEPELPDGDFHNKRPIMKAQRSASIPNIMTEGGHGLRLHSSSLYTSPQAEDKPFLISEHNPNGHHSPLEGLLERAKERDKGDRGKDGFKKDRNVKVSNLRSRYPPPSPSFSTTPSPSPSDGDRDTEWEEEVELMRHRALTVSKGWKEQLVDGDEDEKRDRLV